MRIIEVCLKVRIRSIHKSFTFLKAFCIQQFNGFKMPEVHLYENLMVSCLFIVFMSVGEQCGVLCFRLKYKMLFLWF
jgi:hypothetical protein